MPCYTHSAIIILLNDHIQGLARLIITHFFQWVSMLFISNTFMILETHKTWETPHQAFFVVVDEETETQNAESSLGSYTERAIHLAGPFSKLLMSLSMWVQWTLLLSFYCLDVQLCKYLAAKIHYVHVLIFMKVKNEIFIFSKFKNP